MHVDLDKLMINFSKLILFPKPLCGNTETLGRCTTQCNLDSTQETWGKRQAGAELELTLPSLPGLCPAHLP